ncbi:glycosyl transferase [Capsulimonas corticalis]|uniref:Glycosyl transferase n=1 Tax=Capsulimonas corticalis TaxID=2219043 RepID=A0A402CSC1_9BACT|nr:glycosyltransferase family 4 protein [Capsulimonas corticalis]BDI28316.1 glycosyl transferase [Capsulimonas corticalis]
MRVIMLSWEYPPKIVGGISRHLYDLAHALKAQDVEVHVVTCEHPGAAAEAVEDGIHLYRVVPQGQANDFIHWVHLLNNAMFARADALVQELLGVDSEGNALPPSEDDPIVIHSHDWLAFFAGNELKYKYRLPFVSTIHATEYGRNSGINGPIQEYINSIESRLQHESWRVIVCTEFMKRECEKALLTPWDKMDIIYNGVDASKFQLPEFSEEERAAFRARFAAPEEKIIFFVGRMVREKGVQVLIEALPKIRWGYHDAKLLIVGGGHKDHLYNLASYLGMERHVYFPGFVPDEDLMKIYQIIDIACFPSLYEPFGIVALEAMAAKVPVVVSDAGGLPEVVLNNVTGITTYAGNPNSLGDGILKLLHEPETAKRLAEAAFARLQTDFHWDNIARQTVGTYDRVWSEYITSPWWPGNDGRDLTPPVAASASPAFLDAAALELDTDDSHLVTVDDETEIVETGGSHITEAAQ